MNIAGLKCFEYMKNDFLCQRNIMRKTQVVASESQSGTAESHCGTHECPLGTLLYEVAKVGEIKSMVNT